MSSSSSNGCVQNDFWAYGMFGANRALFGVNHAPILHQQQHYLQMDQNEIPHDPRHLWVPSGGSEMTSEAMVGSAQTVQLSCIKISTISEQTKSSFQLSLVT
jgi:hypothetical protein